MFKILVFAMLVLTITGFSMQAFASSGLGVFLDNRSSDNKHLSFANTTDRQELNSTGDNSTVELKS